MTDVARLTSEERQWLQTVNRGPIVRPSAESAVPAPVLESLLEKRLVRWRYGFAAVSLLVATERGTLAST
jgi:hypothetical protein